MVQVNEYFDGKVKSLTLQSSGGKETVGVMLPGEYTFNTGLREIVTVLSGSMTVLLPDSEEWQLVEKFERFDVVANSSFRLKIYSDTAYLCQYIG